MNHIETDTGTKAEVYQLADDVRPADNIYGEQPYSSADGTRIAVRHYPGDGREGSLSILDLGSGDSEVILDRTPRFPACPRSTPPAFPGASWKACNAPPVLASASPAP